MSPLEQKSEMAELIAGCFLPHVTAFSKSEAAVVRRKALVSAVSMKVNFILAML